MTHTDLDGNTAWEVYANAPQWPGVQGPDAGRLIAEYRYAGAFTPPTTQTSPDSTSWAERTVYVYDDGTTDPSTGYSLPNAERFGLGRVAEVQEWTKSGSTETETDFTHTTYDPVTGQPASIASNEGTVNYAYDGATGRKVRMWTGTDASNAPDDTAYAYDMQGRLTDVYTLVLDGTRYGTYGGIDPTSHNPTFTGTPLDTHYTYDLAGNLKTESQPDQTTTTYTYDDLNRLTDLATQNTSTNEPVFAEHYDLRADGTRSDVTDTRYNADGSVFSQTKVNWVYDGNDRLTSEALVVLAGGSNAPAAYTDVFKFDLDGNRVEEDITGSQNATVTYTYNSNNELGTETRIGDGAYSTTDGYDNAGDLTSQVRTGTNPETDAYTWDLRGRMISATVNGTTTVYTYDTNGVRTSEATGSAATYYLNDPNNPTGYTKAVEESATRGGTPSRAFIFGLQVEGQADATNGALFLLHDGHGNTRALLNVTGGVVEQYNDDAYGNLLASTGAKSNASLALTPWLQPDGLYDPASGWNYNLARLRDGFRFTSMDDSTLFGPGELANANLYSYVKSNPILSNDPSGHLGFVETLGVSSILGGLLGGIAGGITGGVRGAVYGAIGGAVITPILAAGVIGAGIATSSALLYFGVVFSPQVASFVIGTALTAYSVHEISGQIDSIDPAALNADQELKNAEVELAFTMIGWTIGAVALGYSQYVHDVEAGPLRGVYRSMVSKVAPIIDENKNATGGQLEDAAKQVFTIRKEARLAVRGMMSQWINVAVLRARDALEYGNADGPTFEDLVQKAKSRGYSGDDVYRDILGGAARTNAAVDAAFKPQPPSQPPQ